MTRIAPTDFGRHVRSRLTTEKFEEHSAITGGSGAGGDSERLRRELTREGILQDPGKAAIDHDVLAGQEGSPWMAR